MRRVRRVRRLSIAASPWLAQAKLDPSYADAFGALGLYYHSTAVAAAAVAVTSAAWLARAEQCYQRAVGLRPMALAGDAGRALCRLLRRAHRGARAVPSGGAAADAAADAAWRQERLATIEPLCRVATAADVRCSWAWSQISLMQQGRRQWQEAIGSLHGALRGQPGSAVLWESLGARRVPCAGGAGEACVCLCVCACVCVCLCVCACVRVCVCVRRGAGMRRRLVASPSRCSRRGCCCAATATRPSLPSPRRCPLLRTTTPHPWSPPGHIY